MVRFDTNSLRREFAERADDKRHREFERSEKRARRQDNVKVEDAADEELMAIAQAAIEATAENLTQFEEQLTHYEELTVQQIIALRESLDELLEEREILLDNAYVLPDGTKVFRTVDGQSVYDLQGNQISREIIDPALIGRDKTTWEAISANTSRIGDVNAKLDETMKFQSELDDMRDRLNEGDLTADELNDLEQRLERSVPTSIRVRETALEADGKPAKVTPDFAVAASNKINLDTLEISSPGLAR